MKKLILSIIAVAAFCSCQKSKEQTPEVSALAEVVFSSGISTRATGTLWDEGDKIGVFMYEAGESDIYAYRYNAEYSITEGEGTSSAEFTSEDPLYFVRDSKSDFVAYYPYSESAGGGIVSVNTADQSSKEKIKDLDYMVAYTPDCDETSGVTSLEFNRMMSRIIITVIRKESRVDAVLSDLSIKNITTSGSCTIANSASNSVEPASTYSDITIFEDENKQIEAIIVPQSTSSATLYFIIDGEYISVSLSGTFEAGKQYNYNLTLGGDKVEFSEVIICPWDPEDSGEIETTKLNSYVEFKRNESNTANMTKMDNLGTIENLLSKFRRCLMTTDGDGNATICYLDDSNSELYSDDGTVAALDSSEGDVMVYFPEYWYMYKNMDDDYFRYYFSESAQDGYIHVEACLVGAYKAYNEDEMVYSRSGVLPTRVVNQANFKSYARARGTGYQIIDYDQHCTIAMMLYAKYLDRNLQDDSCLGAGSASYETTITGLTNSLGSSDGVATWVNGLGIEGVYGGVGEFIEGVEVNNCVWTITNPTYNTTRTVTASSSSGYITALALESGDYFDMVPTAASGGSGTTYYADYYICYDTTRRVVYRSFYNTGTSGGVSYAFAYYDSSVTYTHIGSRLAFRGTITEAASVEAYKTLFNE